MSNALAKKDIYLDLSIDDDGFDFATSIDDALAQAEAELVVLNETVESIKELKPQCDKLDYILAASSGALCGVRLFYLPMQLLANQDTSQQEPPSSKAKR